MTSAKISSLDEGPYLYPDHLIGGSAGHSVYFKDESQYREHVRRRFESQGWDDTITNLAMRLMPMNEPFVFTHGNLTLNSIFVYGTKVTAIVGLDKAAYLPVWAESLAIHFAHGPAERQWKALLFGYVGYEQIKSYWDVCQDLLVASFKGVQGATESGKRETIQALLATMVEQKEHRESEAAKQVIQSKQNGLMQEVDEGGVQRPTQSEGNNEKPKEDRMSSQSKQTKTDHSSNNEKMLSEKTTNLVIMSDSSTQTDKPTTPRPLSQRPLSHVFRMKTARKDLQVQGQPFTPRPIAARRKPSVFHAASGTQAQNYYPNGFSVLDKKGEGLKCALEAIYDSFTAQYPERRGEISLRSLGLQFLSIKQPQIGVTVGAEYFLEKLAKTLQAWGRSLSEPLDLQLGCILIDGREWLDPSSDGANSGTKAIWITNVNADGIMTFKSAEDFRGLAPNRGKLGVASDSEISPTKIGSKGSIVQGLIDVTGEVDGTDFKVTGIDSGDRQTQNISEMSEVHGNDDNDVQTMPFETRDL
ncbi:hypothetical protein TruAng_004098 [Truncatella angustata]|nr:hypothetical protein TruAng_004098 [Truncatella angustata]